jgi:hypothetical protein
MNSSKVIYIKISRLFILRFSVNILTIHFLKNFSLPDHLTSRLMIYSWGNLKGVSHIENCNNIKSSVTWEITRQNLTYVNLGNLVTVDEVRKLMKATSTIVPALQFMNILLTDHSGHHSSISLRRNLYFNFIWYSNCLNFGQVILFSIFKRMPSRSIQSLFWVTMTVIMTINCHYFKLLMINIK